MAKVHIGKIIESIIKDGKVDITDFAKQINKTRANVYDIFKRPSIDTELLQQISKALNQNLFMHYISEKDILEVKTKKTTAEELLEILAKLKHEADRLSAINPDTEKAKTNKAKKSK